MTDPTLTAIIVHRLQSQNRASITNTPSPDSGRLQRELDQLRGEFQSAQDRIAQLRRQRDDADSDLAEARTSNRSLRNTVRELQDENQRLRSDIHRSQPVSPPHEPMQIDSQPFNNPVPTRHTSGPTNTPSGTSTPSLADRMATPAIPPLHQRISEPAPPLQSRLSSVPTTASSATAPTQPSVTQQWHQSQTADDLPYVHIQPVVINTTPASEPIVRSPTPVLGLRVYNTEEEDDCWSGEDSPDEDTKQKRANKQKVRDANAPIRRQNREDRNRRNREQAARQQQEAHSGVHVVANLRRPREFDPPVQNPPDITDPVSFPSLPASSVPSSSRHQPATRPPTQPSIPQPSFERGGFYAAFRLPEDPKPTNPDYNRTHPGFRVWVPQGPNVAPMIDRTWGPRIPLQLSGRVPSHEREDTKRILNTARPALTPGQIPWLFEESRVSTEGDVNYLIAVLETEHHPNNGLAQQLLGHLKNAASRAPRDNRHPAESHLLSILGHRNRPPWLESNPSYPSKEEKKARRKPLSSSRRDTPRPSSSRPPLGPFAVTNNPNRPSLVEQPAPPPLAMSNSSLVEEKTPQTAKGKEKAVETNDVQDVTMTDAKTPPPDPPVEVMTSSVDLAEDDQYRLTPLTTGLPEDHPYSSLPPLLPGYPPLCRSSFPKWLSHLKEYNPSPIPGLTYPLGDMEKASALRGVLGLAELFPPRERLRAIHVIAVELTQGNLGQLILEVDTPRMRKNLQDPPEHLSEDQIRERTKKAGFTNTEVGQLRKWSTLLTPVPVHAPDRSSTPLGSVDEHGFYKYDDEETIDGPSEVNDTLFGDEPMDF